MHRSDAARSPRTKPGGSCQSGPYPAGRGGQPSANPRGLAGRPAGPAWRAARVASSRPDLEGYAAGDCGASHDQQVLYASVGQLGRAAVGAAPCRGGGDRPAPTAGQLGRQAGCAGGIRVRTSANCGADHGVEPGWPRVALGRILALSIRNCGKSKQAGKCPNMWTGQGRRLPTATCAGHKCKGNSGR